jgi:RecB family exonuclease
MCGATECTDSRRINAEWLAPAVQATGTCPPNTPGSVVSLFMTFLRQTARQIFDRHPHALDHVWVILPSRRAVTVFETELARCSDRPFLAPHTLAVDDFITQAAGVQLIDPVSLLFETYEVFRQIDEKVQFDEFIGWAGVLLADFDRIDQHLVSPTELFSYLTAAKALERWNVDRPAGAKPIIETSGTTHYFQLFENLQTAYHALHARLDAQGLAYRGMAYRRLAVDVETLVRDNSAYEKLYFLGFNALSRAEERVLNVLVTAQKAELIWDADPYYLNDFNQEAGLFLRKYREQPWSGQWPRPADGLLARTPKTIRMVGVETATMQAKVAGKIYADWSANANPQTAPKTAIVLADETLLVPMLYALDDSVNDLNVTMGLSLRQSLLFTLVDAVFDLQQTRVEFSPKKGEKPGRKVSKFHHRQVLKVLNHPFVQQYARLRNLQSPPDTDGQSQPLLGWIVTQIVSKQKVYLEKKEMRRLSPGPDGKPDPLLQTLFKRWLMDKPLSAIRTLYDLTDQLREVYAHTQDAIEIEYLYLFYSLLKQLESTLARQTTPVTVKSFRTFLNELIRQTTIPFATEGNSRLQVMGMLETRALDFERVIILSANEGVLPQARRLNSLIPFDISNELGLPTYREQEAVMAYHFYRLLQRASDVVLIYTTTTDAYGTAKGEPSRYLRQIEHELVPRSGGRVRLLKPVVRFGRPDRAAFGRTQPDHDQQAAPVELTIPKTARTEAKIMTLLAKGLYPTTLNQFVSCSMQFYFRRIMGIREEDDIEERIGKAEFGNWIHHTLERIDKYYRMPGLPVTEAVILHILDEEFAKEMKGRVAESGMNLLQYDLAKRLVLEFLAKQDELPNLEVVSTEQILTTTLDVVLPSGYPLRVRVAGKIDRIERVGDSIRVVDYKTGQVDLPKSAPKDLEDRLQHRADYDKMRQLWLYKYLAIKTIAETGGLPRDKTGTNHYPAGGLPVSAGFYSFRRIGDGLIENPVAFADGDYVEKSEEIIRQLVLAMLDADEPFRKTDQIETCVYCDFKGMCGR